MIGQPQVMCDRTAPGEVDKLEARSEIERPREEAKLDIRPRRNVYTFLGARKSGLTKGHKLAIIELITSGDTTCARCVRLEDWMWACRVCPYRTPT